MDSLNNLYSLLGQKKERAVSPVDQNIIPPNRKDEILHDIVNKFSFAESSRQSMEKKWKEWHNLYRSVYEDHSLFKTKSKLFVPRVFAIIKILSAKIAGAFLRNMDFFDAVPVYTPTSIEQMTRLAENYKPNPEENMTGLDVINNVIRKQVNLLKYQVKTTRMLRKFVSVVQQLLKYGTSFLKIVWDNEQNMPTIVPLNIFDVYLDPKARSFDDCVFVFHRLFLSKEDLLERARLGIYDKEAVKQMILKAEGKKEVVTGIEGVGVESFSTSESFTNPFDETNERKFNRYEILEYWTKSVKITIGDREHILRTDKLDRDIGMLIHCFSIDEEFCLYGIGYIEPIADLQRDVNIRKNQFVDYITQKLRRMWLLRRGAVLDMRQLTNRPDGIIVTEFSPEKSVMPLASQDIPQGALILQQNDMGEIEYATGVNDYISGQNFSTNRKTKYEVDVKKGASDNRYEFNLRLIADDFIAVLNKIMALNRKMYESVIYSAYVNGKWVPETLSKEELALACNYILKSEFTENDKEIRFQKNLLLFKSLNGDRYIDQYYLRKLYLSSFELGEQMENLLLSPKQMIEQAQMEMQAGGQVFNPEIRNLKPPDKFKQEY